ncbi:MAG TPA: CheR family methyltransferase [Terriglobia bacterium]|nr:CheR family methyltransferase [Terriglobia bacterium]
MTKLSESLLSELSELVALRLGLHFPKERWPDLERCVRGALEEADHRDIESGVRSLLSPSWTAGETQMLADHLTVGETYFFRQMRALEILEEHALPLLVRDHPGGSRALRIWSAGCATGEEPYSLAILLSKLGAPWTDGRVTILATDLNRRSLQRACAGVYGDWSFRGAPAWLKQRYFVASPDGRWSLSPAIKKMVVFSHLNLAEDAYPSLLNHTDSMDVILCCNVLMYLAPDVMTKVVRKLYRSLAPGGWLIVSPTETSPTLFSDFVSVSFDGATLYRRATDGNAGRRTRIAEQRDEAARRSPSSVVADDQPNEANSWVEQPEPEVASPSQAGQQMAEPSPTHEDALRLFAAGHYERATEAALVLLSSQPSDAAVMLLLARICANQGRLAEGLTWCENALLADRRVFWAHYLRAAILQEQGSFEEARASLKLALYLNPQFILAHFALGNVTRAQGRLRESEKHFKNALSLLARHRQDDIVPESDGITAGRLREVITLQADQGADGDTNGHRKTNVAAGLAGTRFSRCEDSR